MDVEPPIDGPELPPHRLAWVTFLVVMVGGSIVNHHLETMARKPKLRRIVWNVVFRLGPVSSLRILPAIRITLRGGSTGPFVGAHGMVHRNDRDTVAHRSIDLEGRPHPRVLRARWCVTSSRNSPFHTHPIDTVVVCIESEPVNPLFHAYKIAMHSPTRIKICAHTRFRRLSVGRRYVIHAYFLLVTQSRARTVPPRVFFPLILDGECIYHKKPVRILALVQPTDPPQRVCTQLYRTLVRWDVVCMAVTGAHRCAA